MPYLSASPLRKIATVATRGTDKCESLTEIDLQRSFRSMLLTNRGVRFPVAVGASGYIVSAALVLIVGALVGVLATISRHLHHRRLLVHEPVPPGSASSASASILHHHHRHHHHRHRHRREEPPPPPLQRCLLLQDHYRYPDTPVSII